MVASQLEHVRRMFAEADPLRPAIVVTGTADTPAYVTRTGFPILCPDLYYYGDAGWPWRTNTPASSSASFCRSAAATAEMALRRNKTAWTMPQAARISDGKMWSDDAGNLVLEAGCAIGCRMPTPAEIRYQTWESVRAGCRGVVFFLLSSAPNDWKPGIDPKTLSKRQQDNLKVMDKQLEALKISQDYPLVKQQTNTGAPATLLTPAGGQTPQSRAWGETNAAIEKCDALIGE